MISPQGYQLGADPKSKNPFWNENGEDSSVNRIYATATVDNETGVPYVDTSKSVSGNDITFNFDFHNTKGERGESGAQGPAGPEGPQGPIGETGPQGPAGQDGFSPDIVVAPISNGYHMTIITESGNQEITIANGEKGDKGETGPAGPEGPQGPSGNNGVSPTAKVEQTGDNEATITITDASGTTSAVLRGEAGVQGPEGPQGPKGDTGETGATGATGETGPEGPQGPAGPGVPAGGTAGQVLTKVDGTDYNTQWKDAAGGGSVKVKYPRSMYPSLENIPSRGKITLRDINYVGFENASNIIPIMTSLEIQAGTNDLIVTGIRTYTNNDELTVEVDVYNASSSVYNTSSYPMSPNNVLMNWLVLLI